MGIACVQRQPKQDSELTQHERHRQVQCFPLGALTPRSTHAAGTVTPWCDLHALRQPHIRFDLTKSMKLRTSSHHWLLIPWRAIWA